MAPRADFNALIASYLSGAASAQDVYDATVVFCRPVLDLRDKAMQAGSGDFEALCRDDATIKKRIKSLVSSHGGGIVRCVQHLAGSLSGKGAAESDLVLAAAAMAWRGLEVLSGALSLKPIDYEKLGFNLARACAAAQNHTRCIEISEVLLERLYRIQRQTASENGPRKFVLVESLITGAFRLMSTSMLAVIKKGSANLDPLLAAGQLFYASFLVPVASQCPAESIQQFDVLRRLFWQAGSQSSARECDSGLKCVQLSLLSLFKQRWLQWAQTPRTDASGPFAVWTEVVRCGKHFAKMNTGAQAWSEAICGFYGRLVQDWCDSRGPEAGPLSVSVAAANEFGPFIEHYVSLTSPSGRNELQSHIGSILGLFVGAKDTALPAGSHIVVAWCHAGTALGLLQEQSESEAAQSLGRMNHHLKAVVKGLSRYSSEKPDAEEETTAVSPLCSVVQAAVRPIDSIRRWWRQRVAGIVSGNKESVDESAFPSADVFKAVEQTFLLLAHLAEAVLVDAAPAAPIVSATIDGLTMAANVRFKQSLHIYLPNSSTSDGRSSSFDVSSALNGYQKLVHPTLFRSLGAAAALCADEQSSLGLLNALGNGFRLLASAEALMKHGIAQGVRVESEWRSVAVPCFNLGGELFNRGFNVVAMGPLSRGNSLWQKWTVGLSDDSLREEHITNLARRNEQQAMCESQVLQAAPPPTGDDVPDVMKSLHVAVCLRIAAAKMAASIDPLVDLATVERFAWNDVRRLSEVTTTATSFSIPRPSVAKLAELLRSFSESSDSLDSLPWYSFGQVLSIGEVVAVLEQFVQCYDGLWKCHRAGWIHTPRGAYLQTSCDQLTDHVLKNILGTASAPLLSHRARFILSSARHAHVSGDAVKALSLASEAVECILQIPSSDDAPCTLLDDTASCYFWLGLLLQSQQAPADTKAGNIPTDPVVCFSMALRLWSECIAERCVGLEDVPTEELEEKYESNVACFSHPSDTHHHLCTLSNIFELYDDVSKAVLAAKLVILLNTRVTVEDANALCHVVSYNAKVASLLLGIGYMDRARDYLDSSLSVLCSDEFPPFFHVLEWPEEAEWDGLGGVPNFTADQSSSEPEDDSRSVVLDAHSALVLWIRARVQYLTACHDNVDPHADESSPEDISHLSSWADHTLFAVAQLKEYYLVCTTRSTTPHPLSRNEAAPVLALLLHAEAELLQRAGFIDEALQVSLQSLKWRHQTSTVTGQDILGQTRAPSSSPSAAHPELAGREGNLGAEASVVEEPSAVLTTEWPDVLFYGQHLEQLGQIYALCGSSHTADYYFQQGLKLGEMSRAMSIVYRFVVWLGELSLKRHRWDKSEEYFRRALDMEHTMRQDAEQANIPMSLLGSVARHRMVLTKLRLSTLAVHLDHADQADQHIKDGEILVHELAGQPAIPPSIFAGIIQSTEPKATKKKRGRSKAGAAPAVLLSPPERTPDVRLSVPLEWLSGCLSLSAAHVAEHKNEWPAAHHGYQQAIRRRLSPLDRVEALLRLVRGDLQHHGDTGLEISQSWEQRSLQKSSPVGADGVHQGRIQEWVRHLVDAYMLCHRVGEPSLLRDVCQCLAWLLGGLGDALVWPLVDATCNPDTKRPEWQTSAWLIAALVYESLGITARHQLLASISLKEVQLEREQRRLGNKAQDDGSKSRFEQMRILFSFAPTPPPDVPSPHPLVSLAHRLYHWTQLLPSVWAGVAVCPSPCLDFTVFVRLEAGAPPRFVVHQPPASATILLQPMVEVERILSASRDSAKHEVISAIKTTQDKRTWWDRRKALDKELGELLESTVQHWIGPHVSSIFAPPSRSGDTSSDSFASRDWPCTILMLDKSMQAFPWENMPGLEELSISRLPCIPFAVWLADSKSQEGPARCLNGIQGGSAFYVLNPTGDLKSTEEALLPKFERLHTHGWAGIAGRAPSAEEYSQGLSQHDVFVYCGHSAGEQYLRASALQQLDHCAVTLLMGCSSGALRDAGDFEPDGMVRSYLLAGCPAAVANLWDVTDRDIDRFTDALLGAWLAKPDHRGDLAASLRGARDACTLRFLTAAAPVLYGVPVRAHTLALGGKKGSKAAVTKAAQKPARGKLDAVLEEDSPPPARVARSRGKGESSQRTTRATRRTR